MRIALVLVAACGGSSSGTGDAPGGDGPGDGTQPPAELGATLTGEFAAGNYSLSVTIRAYGKDIDGINVFARGNNQRLVLDTVTVTANGGPVQMRRDNDEEWNSGAAPLAQTYTFAVTKGASSVSDLVFKPADHLQYATITAPVDDQAPVNQDLVVQWTPANQIPIQIHAGDAYDARGIPDTGTHTIPAANLTVPGTLDIQLEQEYGVHIAGLPSDSGLEYRCHAGKSVTLQ